jgi:hypothetical protein
MKNIRTKAPIFENSKSGPGGGFAIVKRYWEQFEFSLLYMQMDKHSGPTSWQLLFAYVCGLLSGSMSVNGISRLLEKSPMLRVILNVKSISQCAFSRFASRSADWKLLSNQRLHKILHDPRMELVSGDVIAIDDTKLAHPHGKNMPFLCWLFDSSDKVNVWCMNLVTTLAVRANGLEFPLSWRFWRKSNPESHETHPSKLELAQDMLLELRNAQPDVHIWVAMDRWFLCKGFFTWLENRNFDWVTKAKSNTALYQLSEYDRNGKPRYRPVNARMLLLQYANLFVGKRKDRLAIAIPNIFMKMPVDVVNRKGKTVKKQEMVKIAAVAICQLPEDVEERESLADKKDKPLLRGTHLIISNRHDSPLEAVSSYVKRWRIEVFYRAAKQDLGLTACRAETEQAHFMHIEMLFVAETLLRLAMKEYQDSGGQEKGDEDILTHGQVIQGLVIANVWVELATPATKRLVHTKFDTSSDRFSRFISQIWPEFIELAPWSDWNKLPATA